MKRHRLRFWSALALASACARANTGSNTLDGTMRFRDELVAFGTADQAIRDTLVRMMQGSSAIDTGVITRQNRGDVQRASWLSARVAERGWPKSSVVGEGAAEAAFLIVQHAVHDTAFQARMLVLLADAARTHDASPQNVALLTDRLLIQRGQPQLYGTQGSLRAGRIVLDPIADSSNVDARRAQIGLPPLKEYLRKLESAYTPKPAS